MFFVGAILESRLIALFEHQSRAFFPGDLALGMIVAILLVLEQENPFKITQRISWWIIVIALSAMIGLFLRSSDVANYPYDISRSPTKFVHDFFGYFGFTTIAIGLGLPRIGVYFKQLYYGYFDPYFTAILALALFYIYLAFYDFEHPASLEDLIARHPEHYQAIWQELSNPLKP